MCVFVCVRLQEGKTHHARALRHALWSQQAGKQPEKKKDVNVSHLHAVQKSEEAKHSPRSLPTQGERGMYVRVGSKALIFFGTSVSHYACSISVLSYM
jgi:hypothetical protein